MKILSGDKTKLKYTPSPNTCKSFSDCRKIQVDTTKRGLVYFMISNVNKAGYASSGTAKINVVCGPKSATITPTNVAGSGSLLTLDALKPNYLVQSIAQDQRSPNKIMYLNRIAVFKSSSADCPIYKYELVSPGQGVRAYSSSRIFFSAADKKPQTFKLKVTASGGATFITPTITIQKTCASVKTSYSTVYNYYAKAGSKTQVVLPFMNIGAADGCGVKKMEVVNDKDHVFTYPAKNTRLPNCPGARCVYVEVDLSKAGSFSLYAKAMLNDGSSISAKKVTINVRCTSSSATLTRSTLKSVTVEVGSKYNYEFDAFKQTGVATCGWREPYRVAVTSKDKTSLKYPPTGASLSSCKSFADCRKVEVNTSKKTSITFTISSRTVAGPTVAGGVRINVVCGPKSAMITLKGTPVAGSILSLDPKTKNVLVQFIPQD